MCTEASRILVSVSLKASGRNDFWVWESLSWSCFEDGWIVSGGRSFFWVVFSFFGRDSCLVFYSLQSFFGISGWKERVVLRVLFCFWNVIISIISYYFFTFVKLTLSLPQIRIISFGDAFTDNLLAQFFF